MIYEVKATANVTHCVRKVFLTTCFNMSPTLVVVVSWQINAIVRYMPRYFWQQSNKLLIIINILHRVDTASFIRGKHF